MRGQTGPVLPPDLPTPIYIIDEARLNENLAILTEVREQTGCQILLAQKAFSMVSLYPLLSRYLDGTTASGLYEARLGREHFPGEVHVFSPSYPHPESVAWAELLGFVDHLVFNSIAQYERGMPTAKQAGKSCGIRLNPAHSTQSESHAMYDPCAPGSRFGVTAAELRRATEQSLQELDGVHFHTLCEQNADALAETLEAIEREDVFVRLLQKAKWVNFGGGHHITRDDYDRELLKRCIKRIQERYDVAVYLEPGEAVVLNSGYLVATVEEFVHRREADYEMDIVILDASATCHMPDVLEVPYRPEIIGAGVPGEYPYTYRLTGPTCLAGDVIGDYSFPEPLVTGQQLVFTDMAHYTMVKNNTFNGMALPSIAILRSDGAFEVVKTFSYDDFQSRL